jgi:hypothetical protein
MRSPLRAALWFALPFSMALPLMLVSMARRARPSAPPPAPSAALLAHSFRGTKNGWIYVHLEGSPRQLGYQNGYWLAPEIERVLVAFHTTMPRRTRKSWGWLQTNLSAMMLPHIEAQYRQELEGIVAGLHDHGVETTLGDIIVLNSFQELYQYIDWYDEQHHVAAAADLPAQGNCSAFVATGSYTRDHKIVIGHNMWIGYFPGEDWNIIYDIVPDRGYHILMDGFPGVITSDDDFFITSAGLMVTETTITGFRGIDPNGIPEFVRSRKAAQYAGSIDRWIAIMLNHNNGGLANDWLLGDRKTNEIARLELGLKHHRVWRTKDGMLAGSNFPSDPALIRDEAPGYDPHDLASSPNARRVRWQQLGREYRGKIDVAIAEKMESDHYDTVLHRVEPDERTLCGHAELSPRAIREWGWGPYQPGGTVQAKVTDSTMAGRLSLMAAMGHPCGIGFDAEAFYKAHPQFDWEKPFLTSMPSHPWTRFSAAQAAR